MPGLAASPLVANLPLYVALVLGGVPLVWGLMGQLLARRFGSDLLAGVSIVTSMFLGEYLAGSFVVLMLSGVGALETYAVRSASSVLEALAKRVPSIAPCAAIRAWSTWLWIKWRSASGAAKEPTATGFAVRRRPTRYNWIAAVHDLSSAAVHVRRNDPCSFI
jgi:hypothetical protein